MPSRLQLAELEQLLAASDALSFMAESAGARPVLTVRNAIQLQCKSFLEDMHTHSLAQLIGKALMMLTCSTTAASIPQSDPACSMASGLLLLARRSRAARQNGSFIPGKLSGLLEATAQFMHFLQSRAVLSCRSC